MDQEEGATGKDEGTMRQNKTKQNEQREEKTREETREETKNGAAERGSTGPAFGQGPGSCRPLLRMRKNDETPFGGEKGEMKTRWGGKERE